MSFKWYTVKIIVSRIHDMNISQVSSKVGYLDALESIVKEVPDLFQALQKNKFD